MPTIVFEQDARVAIRKGVSTLARTVRSTLGPRGRNVMIGKPFGPPIVTKDGVTVAREIVLEDREQLLLRKARLSGGVAKIGVGGSTESEVKQKKMLFDDALNATRAAAEEGVLPGGGVALLRAAQACSPQGISDDEEAGTTSSCGLVEHRCTGLRPTPARTVESWSNAFWTERAATVSTP